MGKMNDNELRLYHALNGDDEYIVGLPIKDFITLCYLDPGFYPEDKEFMEKLGTHLKKMYKRSKKKGVKEHLHDINYDRHLEILIDMEEEGRKR